MAFMENEGAYHVRQRKLHRRKKPEMAVVRLPMNESGAVWDAENSKFMLGRATEKRAAEEARENPGYRSALDERKLSRKLNLARKNARAELEEEIKQFKHPLSLDILTRFEIREKFNQGISVVRLAREYQTSVSVIRGVLKMAENLPGSREEELTRQFLRMSSVMRDILQDVPQSKIRQASLHAQISSAAVLSDKILAIRRSLDGEAAKKLELNQLPSFHDRESMIEAIRQKMEFLQPVLETPHEVIREISEGEEESVDQSPQLFLFPSKETTE